MNLSFSTRGWNSLSWEEQVRDAEEMGFRGIEPYNIQEFPSLSGRGGVFHPYRQIETFRELKKHKISAKKRENRLIDLKFPRFHLFAKEIQTSSLKSVPQIWESRTSKSILSS